MGKKPDINDFVKGQIVTLNAERYSQRDIAKKLKISRGAVENVLRSGGVSRRSNCKGVQKTNHRGITASGRCGLHIFDKGEKVNAKKYLEVLESKLQIHMNISGATIMQQDSATCHTAKIVKKWFSDNNIELLSNWPSNSPDLNVIENCWQIMKRKVAAHRPTSEKDLKEVLKRVWTIEITPEYCRALVHSMPDRINAVLKNKGYPVNY
jgi:transposase